MNPILRKTIWTGAGFVGFMLSPLTWWNDLWVNLPLSYMAANIAAWFNPRWFMSALLGAYLGTNVLGLLLMHLASQGIIKGKGQPINRKAILISIVTAAIYTVIVITMFRLGWIQPLLPHQK